MLYSGSEGSFAGLAEVRARGMGIMITAAGWRNPKPGIPWALDNGAFSSWVAGETFDVRRFERVVRKVPSAHRPDFAVIPDIVAGGLSSLVFSLSSLRWLPHGWPWYLAVQDGMEPKDVEPHVNEVSGIFVGGTLDWKVARGEEWVAFAHMHDLPCHIGRCGTVERLVWARRIGADSADSMSWARNASYRLVDDAARQRTLGEVVG